MADKKVTQLDALAALSGDDLFMVVDDPAGTPTNKKVTTTNLFGNVAVPAVFNDSVTLSGDSSTISGNTSVTGNLSLPQTTPANSTNTNYPVVTLWADGSFIYVAVSETLIKRASLSEF